MSGNKNENELTKKEQTMLTSYQSITNYVIFEVNTIWTKFQHFLLVNSILAVPAVMLIVQNIKGDNSLYTIITMVISAIAIVSGIVCLIVQKRGDAYRKYWFERLREIEKEFGDDMENIFTISKELADEKRRCYNDVVFPRKWTSANRAYQRSVWVFILAWGVLLTYYGIIVLCNNC